MTIKELQEKKAAKAKEMRALHDKAAAEKRDMTAEETAQFEALKKEADGINAQIAQLTGLEQLEAEIEQVKPAAARQQASGGIPRAGGPEAPKEFENIGEFLAAARFNPGDQRLQAASDMSTGSGSQGGFALPKQFIPTLRSVTPQEAVIRPRATVIPAGDPPDGEVSMPALDQSSVNSVGGATVQWIGEGAAKPQTDIALREITLKPHEVAAHVVITDKLLRNWGAASSVIEQQLRTAVIHAEERAFLRGDGVAKPLGILNSGALIKVNRAQANEIAYADVADMFSNIRLTPGLAWLANQSALPQLMKMEDTEGHLVWQPSAREGEPALLMGRPVLWSEFSPALGTLGDLTLADLSSYLIKDGSGPFVEASPHVYFLNNKTVIKITWNVDGQPWLKEPIKGEDSRLYSPFVSLDVPTGS